MVVRQHLSALKQLVPVRHTRELAVFAVSIDDIDGQREAWLPLWGSFSDN